jgi:hypothetical protein
MDPFSVLGQQLRAAEFAVHLPHTMLMINQVTHDMTGDMTWRRPAQSSPVQYVPEAAVFITILILMNANEMKCNVHDAMQQKTKTSSTNTPPPTINPSRRLLPLYCSLTRTETCADPPDLIHLFFYLTRLGRFGSSSGPDDTRNNPFLAFPKPPLPS